MMHRVSAEFLKLRTTWGVWFYLAGLVALVALSVAGSIASRPDEVPFVDADFREAVEAAGSASLFALLLGLVAFTVEFRHGTIAQTFLVTPVRERLLAAKALAFAVVGVGLALLALALALAIAVPWLRSRGFDVSPADPEIRSLAAGTIVSCALWGMLGVAIGAAVRNQVAAVIGVLVWIFVVETAIDALAPDSIAVYFPAAADRALTASRFEGDLSPLAGGLVSAAWTAAALAVATVLLRRRDVS